MYATASQKIISSSFVVRTHKAQSAAKPSHSTRNRFWPNAFKKFPAHIHKNTFCRKGLIHKIAMRGT